MLVLHGVSVFELDHVWIRALDPAGTREELLAAGLVEGEAGVHHGVGTANVVFYFDNVYLELLWVHDVSEIRSESVRRTRLFERLSDGTASPFGVSFRRVKGTKAPMPVPTWSWPLPFLPPDAIPMPVAASSANLDEPLVFASLVTSRPDRLRVRRQSIGREVTRLIGGVQRGSPTIQSMVAHGIAHFPVGPEPRATLTLDGGRGGQRLDVESVPLTLCW